MSAQVRFSSFIVVYIFPSKVFDFSRKAHPSVCFQLRPGGEPFGVEPAPDAQVSVLEAGEEPLLLGARRGDPGPGPGPNQLPGGLGRRQLRTGQGAQPQRKLRIAQACASVFADSADPGNALRGQDRDGSVAPASSSQARVSSQSRAPVSARASSSKAQPPWPSRAARKSIGTCNGSFSLPPQAQSRQRVIISTAKRILRRTWVHSLFNFCTTRTAKCRPYFRYKCRFAIMSVGVMPRWPQASAQ